MSLFTDKRAEGLQHHHWLMDRILVRWLLEHIEISGGTICDVGAGDGFLLRFLGTRFAQVIAVEPSPAAMHLLRPEAARLGAVAVSAYAEAIPLPDDSVNVAFAKSALHHFASMNQGLSEMARIASDMIAVVEVIAPNELALRFARQLLPWKEPGRDESRVFTEESLSTLIAPFGTNITCLHFDQYINVDVWLNHSDLELSVRSEIHQFIAGQDATVKQAQRISDLILNNARCVKETAKVPRLLWPLTRHLAFICSGVASEHSATISVIQTPSLTL